MEEKNLICIGCPMGCPLTVKMEHGEVVSVTGNTCKRGDIYARSNKSDQDRDLHRKSHRRKRSDGFCKDERRYSERKNI